MKKIDKKFGIEYDVETTFVTSECTPEEKMIGLDQKLHTGNHLWVPNEFTDLNMPTIMAITGEKDGLYSVIFSQPLIKPIPLGTEMIIVETAPTLINGKP